MSYIGGMHGSSLERQATNSAIDWREVQTGVGANQWSDGTSCVIVDLKTLSIFP